MRRGCPATPAPCTDRLCARRCPPFVDLKPVKSVFEFDRVDKMCIRDRLSAEDGRPPRPYEPALQAIREADLIVLGPGSLFTLSLIHI